MTQSAMILAHLKTGKPLTGIEALNRFGSLRLGARIFDLKQAGYEIKARRVETASGKRVAQYWMEAE